MGGEGLKDRRLPIFSIIMSQCGDYISYPSPLPVTPLVGVVWRTRGGGVEESEWNTTEIVDELIDALAK